MKMQAWPIGAGEMRTQGRPLWTMPKQVAQIAMDIAKNVAGRSGDTRRKIEAASDR